MTEWRIKHANPAPRQMQNTQLGALADQLWEQDSLDKLQRGVA